MNLINRRHFVKQFTCLSLSPFFIPSIEIFRARQKVALQLVSVIPSCNEDLVGTFKSLAEMGYKGVEFSSKFGNLFGSSPVEMRKIMADYGLLCAGWHPIP